MIKAMRVNKTIVCFIENKQYQKEFDTDEEILKVFEQISNTDEDDFDDLLELKMIFAPAATKEEIELQEKIEDTKKQIENQKELIDWLKKISEEGDEHFEVDGTKLYMKGIKITVPKFLAVEFINRRSNNEDYQALINFWRLLALNSDPRCRENLFTFLSKHDIAVTQSGYFVAYRNVDIKQAGDKELNDYVVNMWLKIKNWKKSPKNYIVVKKDLFYYETLLEHQAGNLEVIGNLDDLYSNPIGEETIYTDHHTGTFNIKIGELVSMPKEETDQSQDNQCSSGLHLASSSWLSKNYYGQQGIVCLVNPMHVVSVPYADAGKLRCHAYLPIGLAEYGDNNRIIPIETSTFEHEFCEHTEAELSDMLQSCNLEELKEHEIIPKELDLQSLMNIRTEIKITLEDMNKIISNKVIKVNA